MNNKNKLLGFTLIEVLIALVILAIALTAIVKATQDGIRDTTEVRDRIIAQWAAMNIMTKIQLGLLPAPTPSQANEGQMTLLKYSWHWRASVVATGIAQPDHAQYKQIRIQISHHHQPIATVFGFINTGINQQEA